MPKPKTVTPAEAEDQTTPEAAVIDGEEAATDNSSSDAGSNPGSSSNAVQRQLDEAMERIAQLERDRTSLTSDLQAQRRAARCADWKARVKDFNLPAALVNGHTSAELPGVVNHAEGEPYTLAEFAASLNPNQETWFSSHLESIAGIYKSLREELTPVDGPLDQGGEQSPEDLVRLAEQYQAEEASKGRNVEFKVALDEVMRIHNIQS